MDPLLVGILGLVVLLLLLACGVHIGLCLGIVGLLGTTLIIGFQPAVWMAASVVYHAIAQVTFVVLAMFIFMGVMAGAGGISGDIYKALGLWIGRIRGGVGITTVASCAAFGVVTGSSLVTSAVFAKICAPEMRHYNYNKKIAYGICASAGSIGMLIPPSTLIVIYAIISEQSVGKLLIAGIAPGILLAVIFSAGILFMSFISPASVGVGAAAPRVTWRQRTTGLRLLWPVFVVGAIIIGGIFGGVFSPTEAGAFGALVVLIITVCRPGIKRWELIRSGLLESVSINAMIFFLFAGASVFARFLMLSGVTPRILEFIIGSGLSNLGFVIVMALVYLVMGCFLDAISMLLITLPIIIPVIHGMGIDPIWFAMVNILAIEVGLITPPVGLNVYAAKGVAEPDVSLEDIFGGVSPFFFMMLAALVIMIAFPWLSIILPSIMFGD